MMPKAVPSRPAGPGGPPPPVVPLGPAEVELEPIVEAEPSQPVEPAAGLKPGAAPVEDPPEIEDVPDEPEVPEIAAAAGVARPGAARAAAIEEDLPDAELTDDIPGEGDLSDDVPGAADTTDVRGEADTTDDVPGAADTEDAGSVAPVDADTTTIVSAARPGVATAARTSAASAAAAVAGAAPVARVAPSAGAARVATDPVVSETDDVDETAQDVGDADEEVPDLGDGEDAAADVAPEPDGDVDTNIPPVAAGDDTDDVLVAATASTPSAIVAPPQGGQPRAGPSAGFREVAFSPSESIRRAPLVPGVPASELKPPTSPGEVREFVRAAAIARGIDPDIAVRVVLSEGGFTPATWTGDHASSFGPFQLHYGAIATGGNAVAGLGDAFTAETRLRADDPANWRRQVEWALDHAATTGWTPWHGAAAAGISRFEGIGTYSVQPGPGAVQGARGPLEVPNQFASGLAAVEAYAACGPVAAVAMARWLGRNPTVSEALLRAKQTGWTAAGGMNGIANEKRLLDVMQIPARLETPVNWQHVRLDAVNRNPVIISTTGHYWVIDDYDFTTRKFHVGNSGLAYRGGSEWMSDSEIQLLGGQVNGALYVEHPLAGQPSLVIAQPAQPVGEPLARTASANSGNHLRAERWWEDSREVVEAPRKLV